MIYDTSNKEEITSLMQKISDLISKEAMTEVKEKRKTRSLLQNRALHLYFKFISDELNNLGLEFTYQGLNISNLSTRYTEKIVKDFIWRPIQIALFDVESTTKIDTKQMNEVIDVITKYFAEKGVKLIFPNIETLIEYE